MPEGDTLHRAAQRLQPLVGEALTRVAGSHRAAVLHGRRLVGNRVDRVTARGKHLMILVDNGWAIRTHLGMTGSWRLYGSGERWRITPGKARLVLETGQWTAVCFAAPTVAIGPAARIEEHLARLGPDLLHDEVAWAEVVRRARRSGAATVADLLLDQSVMAGIGNVYKNEVLFLEQIHPSTPPAECEDAVVVRLGRRAQLLLTVNADRATRTTTGRRARGHELWVYGRGGRPCRRCSALIEVDGVASGDRLSYWCPRCQPAHSVRSAKASNG